jgi:hypothetical protein
MEFFVESHDAARSVAWSQANHETWLRALGGEPGAHDWGTGSACYEPERGMSSLLVRYTNWDAA